MFTFSTVVLKLRCSLSIALVMNYLTLVHCRGGDSTVCLGAVQC